MGGFLCLFYGHSLIPWWASGGLGGSVWEFTGLTWKFVGLISKFLGLILGFVGLI
jgi:hypothetical protein